MDAADFDGFDGFVDGGGSKKTAYLLNRRLFSPCGQPMHGGSDRRHQAFYYRCARARYEFDDRRCWCPRGVDATGRHRQCSRRSTTPSATQSCWVKRPSEPTRRRVEWFGLLQRSVERQAAALMVRLREHLDANVDPADLPAEVWSMNTRLKRSRLRLAADSRAVIAAEHAAGLYHGRCAKDPMAVWLDCFDVRVSVEGTVVCPDCGGRGVVPFAAAGRGAGVAGVVCPTCERYRRMPRLKITAALPDGGGRFMLPRPGASTGDASTS